MGEVATFRIASSFMHDTSTSLSAIGDVNKHRKTSPHCELFCFFFNKIMVHSGFDDGRCENQSFYRYE